MSVCASMPVASIAHNALCVRRLVNLTKGNKCRECDWHLSIQAERRFRGWNGLLGTALLLWLPSTITVFRMHASNTCIIHLISICHLTCCDYACSHLVVRFRCEDVSLRGCILSLWMLKGEHPAACSDWISEATPEFSSTCLVSCS